MFIRQHIVLNPCTCQYIPDDILRLTVYKGCLDGHSVKLHHVIFYHYFLPVVRVTASDISINQAVKVILISKLNACFIHIFELQDSLKLW